jgi:hypothetical protein
MVEALHVGRASDAPMDMKPGAAELCREEERPLVPESAAAERSHADDALAAADFELLGENLQDVPVSPPNAGMSGARLDDAAASKTAPCTGPGAHSKGVETSLVRRDDAADTSVRATEPAPIQPPLLPKRPTITRYVPVAAAAAMALVAIVFVLAHHGTPEPPAVAIVPPPVGEASRAIPARAIPAHVIPASVPKQPLSSWRVIAYTYARHLDAEKKVQSINTRFAGIHAEVFAVGSSYLVSLGAHLTRDQAAALQRKVIGKGLPRDTYIQNFRSEE